MNFNTLQYIYFYFCILCLFYIIPKNARKYILLAASYYFYMCWNKLYIFLILISTITTYLSGLLIKKQNVRTGKKLFLTIGILINLFILFYFKYANFCLSSINFLTTKINNTAFFQPLNILLPVGISFYTFQAIGYLIDIYSEKCSPENNIFNYALFISFFPQLVAGPIERTSDLLPQIKNIRNISFSYTDILSGWITMLYGFFIKITLADRLSIASDYIFSNYSTQNSFILILGVICFSMQIYCDFYGYSLIAIGTARTLGIHLSDNFNRPYLSPSIKTFWRNWHISLSLWLRDYLYIPLGGNRCSNLKRI